MTDISFEINNSIKQRNKRVLDIIYSIIFLLLLPIVFWGVKNKIGFLKNILVVLLGKKTWVGYQSIDLSYNLPQLKPAILTPIDALKTIPSSAETIHRVHLFYAKDYSSNRDFNIICKAWKKLGKQ